MSKYKVLVLDDEEGQRDQWKEALGVTPGFDESFEIVPADTSQFRDALAGLERRRRACRDSAEISESERNLFDSADVLLVDFDLLKLSEEERETGENVAYLARVYSDCGSIIGINQFGDNTFDLTLRADEYSWADLNLGSGQLNRPGLWTSVWHPASADGAFRPWSWPLLPTFVAQVRSRSRIVCENIDEPIMKTLRFPEEVFLGLPRTVLEFLGPLEEPERITFREFAEKSRNGLRRKDKATLQGLARLCAARLGKWLETSLLAGQEILVDAPHLIPRYPSVRLLGSSDVQGMSAWNSLANLPGDLTRFAQIEEFRFMADDWLSRPAWFGRRLAGSEMIFELYSDQIDPLPDVVFCEDRSCFVPADCAREFVAEVSGSPYSRRFVWPRESEGVNYSPGVRFAL